MSECIPRIRHCFSTNGPGKEKQWSLALERAWRHSYYCIISLCKLSPSNRRNFKKFIHWRKNAQDARYSRMQILTMKERLEERSASMSLEIAFFFQKLYITESFQTLKTFLPLDFFKRCFKKNFCFQQPQNSPWIDEMTRAFSASTGIDGVRLAYHIKQALSPFLLNEIFRNKRW